MGEFQVEGYLDDDMRSSEGKDSRKLYKTGTSRFVTQVNSSDLQFAQPTDRATSVPAPSRRVETPRRFYIEGRVNPIQGLTVE